MHSDPRTKPDEDPPLPEEEEAEVDEGVENIEEVGEPFDGNFA